MGTRHITRVFDDFNPSAVVLCMYGQYDGHPDSHGKELAEFISGKTMVNGLGDRTATVANGAGCLAALIVAHFKTEPGYFYLRPADAENEEFNYEVRPQGAGKPVLIKCFSGDDLEFEGTAEAYLAWIKAGEDL